MTHGTRIRSGGDRVVEFEPPDLDRTAWLASGARLTPAGRGPFL